MRAVLSTTPASLSRRSGIRDAVPSLQKEGNSKKIEFACSIIIHQAIWGGELSLP